jgi:hypothetical protein
MISFGRNLKFKFPFVAFIRSCYQILYPIKRRYGISFNISEYTIWELVSFENHCSLRHLDECSYLYKHRFNQRG